MMGNEPARVSEQVIEDLRERESADGFVVLPRDKFKRGDRVRVERGVFEGQSGIYEGMSGSQRVKVLFNVLGRKTTVLIAQDMLVAA